jgi:hypothetical protein
VTPLRDHLLDAYGGFADGRHKDPDLDRPIRVDDRNANDVYPDFCSMFVSVPERHGIALVLTLQHCPISPEVIDLVEALGGTSHPADFGPTITLHLEATQGPAIRRLAGAIKGIVARGRTCDDPNHRWICPRTAESLTTLAEHLADHCSERWPDEDAPRSPDPIRARRRDVHIPSPPGGHRPGPSNGRRNGSAG